MEFEAVIKSMNEEELLEVKTILTNIINNRKTTHEDVPQVEPASA